LTFSVAYGRGGTRIATITNDRLPTPSDPGASSLRLWDTATLQQVGNALSLPVTIEAARIVGTRNGERLVNGGIDSAVVWDIGPSSWERLACRIANRSLTRAEWDRYLPGRPYDPAC
jgi:hypothetical protein